jgi:hypothetical protein
MPKKKIESVSNSMPDDLSYAGIDEYLAEVDAIVAAMSDEDIWKLANKHRKEAGIPEISFKEYMGYPKK